LGEVDLMDEDERLVRPDGLSVRRRRHDLSFSPRELLDAIGRASVIATGMRETLTPSQLQGIEERAERIPYSMLRLIAGGLDCDPADILADQAGGGAPARPGGSRA
jgi:DNA-binding Xre family transcriptional regulator